MRFLQKCVTYVWSLPRVYSIGGAAVIVALVLGGVHFATRSAPAATGTSQNISHVQVSSVATLSSQMGPLPVTGKVTSLSEATILAQSSGEIVSLSHALGDHVAAGDIIAEFDNSSQQAAVLQAQGAYDAAQATLQKTTGSSAANAGVTSGQATLAAANAQAAAETALQSTYAALDDAVHTKADTLFSNPRTISPVFILSIPDSQLTITLQNERSQLDSVVANANTLASDTASADIDANSTAMIANAQTVLTFLNNIIKAANEAQSSQNISATALAGYQTSMGAARTEVTNAISALTSAKSAYDSAAAGAQTAANSAGAGSQSDIAAAQAQVKEALGALDAAQANLQKTIIRSPISGTIVSLPITQGDYVSSFSEVADVSNPSALEVTAYVTPDDAKTIAVGGKAMIDGATPGVIVSIAPALDPTTNKIQVKIGITGSQSALTDGDTVAVVLTRIAAASAKNNTGASSAMVIPIVAAKITPEGPVVFTVSTSSTLVANAITLGSILGDQVTVVSGLTPDMDIVTDARGLADGQSVIVDMPAQTAAQ